MEKLKNKLNQYLQNMLQFEKMKHKIYEHIINELHEDNLFILENDLGVFAGVYLFNLHENLKEFESIVNKDIEVNNFDSATIELIKNQKQEAESLIKSRLEYYQEVGRQKAEFDIDLNKQFERYFNSLYSTLNSIAENESNESLQSKADEITKALHDAKYNYSISEFSENHIERLKELRQTFETRIQNRFAIESVEPREAQSKADKIRKEQYLCFGGLMAQDLITIGSYNSILYQNNEYSSRELGKKIDTPHQYINDTLFGGSKSIYTKVRYKKIVNYCKEKNIEISPIFKQNYKKYHLTES